MPHSRLSRFVTRGAIFPNYPLLIESYTKAQEMVARHEVLDSVR